MRVGRVEGYSANHVSGHLSLQANIFQLLNDWDDSLDKVFDLIGERVYGDQLCQKI